MTSTLPFVARLAFLIASAVAAPAQTPAAMQEALPRSDQLTVVDDQLRWCGPNGLQILKVDRPQSGHVDLGGFRVAVARDLFRTPVATLKGLRVAVAALSKSEVEPTWSKQRPLEFSMLHPLGRVLTDSMQRGGSRLR